MSFDQVNLESLGAPIKNAIVGGTFGSNLVGKDYTPSGIPVIRGQNMGERWVGGDFVFVSEEKGNALAPNKARPGDLVFTQRGTLGQVAIVPAGRFSEYIVSQSQMKITLDPSKADVNFVYYVFRSPEQLEYIKNTSIQTGVPHTNLGILKKTPIQLPPLKMQREIGMMLGALDDRIALLRETKPRSKPSPRRCSSRGLSISTPFAPRWKAAPPRAWTRPRRRCFLIGWKSRSWG